MKAKVIISALLLVVITAIGSYIVFDNGSGESVVNAYVNGDKTNQEKVIFLERRYKEEVGELEILLNNSDLCTAKYLNELSTLSINLNETVDGYNDLDKFMKMSDYTSLNEKTNDFKEIVKNYDLMVDAINDEKYEEAIKYLDIIEPLIGKKYNDIPKEITEVE